MVGQLVKFLLMRRNPNRSSSGQVIVQYARMFTVHMPACSLFKMEAVVSLNPSNRRMQDYLYTANTNALSQTAVVGEVKSTY